MNCPECAQVNADVLPRYGVATEKELKRAAERGLAFTIRAGDHCQTCLKARVDAIQML